jgi:hypothetical protein
MDFERYAIYWAPRDGDALAEFEKLWFAPADDPVATMNAAPFSLEASLWREATASPRRYRLHATMKAPFRPAGGIGEDDLRQALARFCAVRRRPLAGPLRLASFPRYLALVPDGQTWQIDWLAAECVTAFDAFRAPLNEEDRARRPHDLPPRLRRNLESFGYPLIFDAFEFHITLAGPLEPDDLRAVREALAPHCETFGGEPFRLDDLCLFGDPGGGAPFRLIERFALRR